MQYYLVEFKKDWEDEFDVCGFELFTEEQWIRAIDKLEVNTDVEFNIYFGTNEGWEDITWGEMRKSIKVHEIPEGIYEYLCSIRMRSFGTIDIIAYMVGELFELEEEN